MSITNPSYCPGEGRLEVASRSYFQFALEIHLTRELLAAGQVAVNSALHFMTTAGDNWGTLKSQQLQQCFEAVAAGDCPYYPPTRTTITKTSEL